MPQRTVKPPLEVADDELALYGTVFAIGVLRVAVAMFGRTVIDRETTLALMMAVFGTVGMFRTWRRARG